jgi:hypothetical protein
MTARSRPPTDQQRTKVYDPDDSHRQRTKYGLEIGTPTEVTPPPEEPIARAGAASSAPAAGAERGEPIRVFSMKAQGAPSEERPPVKQHQPRLRRLSEVSPQRRAAMTPPGGLGYLAPPRDPRQVRTRRWREYVQWGSAVVILAGAVMLGVWFLAGG